MNNPIQNSINQSYALEQTVHPAFEGIYKHLKENEYLDGPLTF